MLKTPLSPKSNKTKRRQLLSLNRPRKTTPKSFDDTSSTATITTTFEASPPRSPVSIATSPPMTLNQDTVESPKIQPKSNEHTSTSLGEYHCPICNKDLSTLSTNYSRQRHIDICLSSTDDDGTTTNDMAKPGDDQTLESLFMDYCSFCGKPIAHLKGVHKERHFDQCLTALENEQKLAEQQQQLTTYAGHSIPFLQDMDVCPVCHDTLPGSSLRNKISHIKRCAKQRSLSMEQLLRKIQWMQWGHLPIQNISSSLSSSSSPSSATTTPDTSSSTSSSSPSSCTTAPRISYSIHATERPARTTTTSDVITTTRSTPALITKNSMKQADYTSSSTTSQAIEYGDDDDFKKDVLIYKVASWHQTRFRTPKEVPTEEESIAMALSLSLMDDDDGGQQQSRRNLSKRKKRKVNLDVANIVSIEESRALAKLALANMLNKHMDSDNGGGDHGDDSVLRFPLVTSYVQPTLPPRQNFLPCGPLSMSSTTLWSQASCLDSD